MIQYVWALILSGAEYTLHWPFWKVQSCGLPMLPLMSQHLHAHAHYHGAWLPPDCQRVFALLCRNVTQINAFSAWTNHADAVSDRPQMEIYGTFLYVAYLDLGGVACLSGILHHAWQISEYASEGLARCVSTNLETVKSKKCECLHLFGCRPKQLQCLTVGFNVQRVVFIRNFNFNLMNGTDFHASTNKVPLFSG